jgi:predicted molibdopterin-dependent oxidoreductase YjgC
LTKPLVKRNGNFERVSWEQALEEVATEFKRIKDMYGADSLAVLGSSKCTNEENYLLQRVARCVLGTNDIDNSSRLYNAGTINHSGTLEQLERSKVIIVIGDNPSSSAPLVSYAIKRAVKYQGAKLILIDPRRTDLAAFAHLWLRPKVSTAIALLNSLSKVIIDEDLFDKGTISQQEGFQALNKVLQKYSPKHAESVTGVSADEIRSAARLYASADLAAIVYGTGITQSVSAADGIKALTNLAILTGNTQRAGGGIYALQQESNGQGTCDMGALPDFLPGHHSLADAAARKKFEEQWKASLPTDAGLTAIEMLEQARSGKIKGMWIIGENPLLSFPDGKTVSEALAALEFLVVQDMFPTETSKLARVVLPAASFAEKEGTFTNFEGRVNKVRKAIEPIGESLPDWEIILKLAGKMGSPLPFTSLQQITDEIEKLVPSFKVSAPERRPSSEQPPKSTTQISPVEYKPQRESPEKDYPLTLLTGTTLYHFGSDTRSSRGRRLKKFHAQASVELGKSDAEKLGISQGDKVKVISPGGELTATASITDTLLDGMLFMPISSPGVSVGQLLDIDLDQETKTPSLKTCKVRIERIGA